MSVELAVIVPTFQERDNVGRLVAALETALEGITWEVIFVDDDSPDGTATAIREIALTDSRVRCLQRLDRRGLASACVEGILASGAPYVAVMDADLQHDERILPAMLTSLRDGSVDLVIGTRYMPGGSTGELSRRRIRISRFATAMSRMLIGRGVSDPMSGYFVLRRSCFEKIMRNLSGRGFKILLDVLLAGAGEIRVSEQPYVMRSRAHGNSKLGAAVIWDFLVLLMYRGLRRLLPARFISFAFVGSTGIAVNMAVLWLLHRLVEFDFLASQAIATLVAMTSNFLLNNHFTFRERKRSGAALLPGLLSFYVACSFGALINLAVAELLFERAAAWWLAGGMGAVSAAVWNYAISATFTWRVAATLRRGPRTTAGTQQSGAE